MMFGAFCRRGIFFVARQIENALCFLTGGGDGSSDIDLVVTTSQTTGVAPFAVHFSTVGTTSTLTDHPFEELEYCWEFGDSGPSAGTWATTGKSKNDARGPVAGHVYETPGIYDVTLHVRD